MEQSSTTSPTVEVLRKARALIEERGWIQGDSESPHGFCAAGAMDAAGGYGYDDPVQRTFRNALGIELTSVWNDDPSRTKEEVLAAFDKAIEVAS